MPKTKSELLTADAVQRLDSMELRARTIVEGHFSGQHRSPYKGASVEFADHREYSPGDELRHIDWKVYGRTDRFFIKEYHAETNMSVHLLLDASRSMDYASGGVTKLRYAACLAAALAYLTIKQRDAPALVAFDTDVRTHLAPATKWSHLTAVCEALEGLEPGAETDVAAALERVAQALTRRGLVVLISDLLDEPEQVLRALGYFRHRGHDLIVMHVMDPAERDFAFRGPVRFRDLETGERLLTETSAIRDGYLQALRTFCQTYEQGCRERFIDYTLLDTSEPFERALVSYLGRRHARMSV